MCGRIDGVANFRILNSITVSTTKLVLPITSRYSFGCRTTTSRHILSYVVQRQGTVHGAIFYTLSYQFIALQNIVAYAWLFVVRLSGFRLSNSVRYKFLKLKKMETEKVVF